MSNNKAFDNRNINLDANAIIKAPIISSQKLAAEIMNNTPYMSGLQEFIANIALVQKEVTIAIKLIIFTNT